jgi:hypothetical protein
VLACVVLALHLSLFSGGSIVGIVAVSLQRLSHRASSVAFAPASLAQAAGASPMGAQALLGIATEVSARVAFTPARSAPAKAMPPCSLHHRGASATAAHNRSIHTDAQVLSAASRPRLIGAGDFQR